MDPESLKKRIGLLTVLSTVLKCLENYYINYKSIISLFIAYDT